MGENMVSVIDLLRDTLRYIEENCDARGTEPMVDKLKNEFRRTIDRLELLQDRESANGRSGSHQDSLLP